jgi:hypothetical protein
LLSIDDVIEHELILFVTLNVNKNTEPVRALGKMLLQNLQLVVGKRYESEAERRRMNKPIFSVVLDEFAPFGYRNFAQILQTARGTNTAFLFSMQSLPQLLQVGKGFKEDVTSAPNTKISLRTQDEETAKFFIRASAEHTVKKRTVSLQRGELFGWERFEKGTSGSEREEREYRVEDERIKNLPKGQMQILMTDDTQGTLHRHLHVRPPQDVGLSDLDTVLAPRPPAVPGGRPRGQSAVQEPAVGRAIRASSAREEVVVTMHIQRKARLVVLLGAFAAAALYGQRPQGPQPLQPGEPAGGVRRSAPKAVPAPKAEQSPAAHYSPLAVQGGYRGRRTTWYDALFHSLNPKNIDWGTRWEERRAAFLESTVANKYFVFCAFLVLCFYAAAVAIGWIVWDHKKDIRYFETELVKARNWATYWKSRAVEAITKHNGHIERCNRVIEAGETGTPVGDAAEAIDLRLELERTRAELQNVTSEKLRLKGELDEKARTISELSLRVDAVSKRISNGTPDNDSARTASSEDKAALVGRINRLEAALATATQENRRLKGA